MLKAGLTGGYATGKSFVAGALEHLGCLVVYADRLGHSVLEIGGDAYGATVELFGDGILLPDGSIDRKALGSLVFDSPDRLAQLNSLVHPAVFRLEAEMLEKWDAEHPGGIAVVEAAILIETGRYSFFERLIVTTCSEETQILRGMQRDRLSREEVLARLARQISSSEKEEYADYIIDTNGTKEDTLRQVDDMFQELRTLAEKQVT